MKFHTIWILPLIPFLAGASLQDPPAKRCAAAHQGTLLAGGSCCPSIHNIQTIKEKAPTTCNQESCEWELKITIGNFGGCDEDDIVVTMNGSPGSIQADGTWEFTVISTLPCSSSPPGSEATFHFVVKLSGVFKCGYDLKLTCSDCTVP